MMNSVQMILSRQHFPEVFAFAEKNSVLSKNLYNAALFRLRQTFTGCEKESRSEHEREVFTEIEKTIQATNGKFKPKRILNYNALDKILRANENPDFFSGLPMQTAQAVVRAAASDFSNWLKALTEYKKSPGKFTGRPNMPGYKKGTRMTFTVTNQDAVLYPSDAGDNCMLKLPGFSKGKRVPLKYLSSDANLRQVSFKPYYGTFIMTFAVEDMAPFFHPDLPNFAGIDLGTDNIAAVVCTDASSIVYKGGAVLSENQWFAKEKAKAVSIIAKGRDDTHASSRHLNRLSMHHDCFLKDQMHKISCDIIRYCVEHRVGTIVLGTNKLWKQSASMGKRNNQTFVTIPHARLRNMILYKALSAGITVVEQEESYTSKADVTANDPIPVYGQEKENPHFSGSRMKRGLYRCHHGLLINADCNGAANILRKAFPNIWKHIPDFRFLAVPESRGFWKLNPKYRIA